MSVSWSIVSFVEQGSRRLDFEEVGEFQPCGPCVITLSVLAVFALVLTSHLLGEATSIRKPLCFINVTS